MDWMIEVERLSKRFEHLIAVDEISFNVGQGEVLGFLGPNGAGKSTTMKIITGFLTPTSGTVKVCGHDVVDDALAAKRNIGYLPEGAPAYGEMTPAKFLSFIASIRGLTGIRKSDAIRTAVARVNIENVLQQPIETLSKGFKRRVGLAQAILHDPPVLILDEPTDGLDPNQKHEVRNLIRTMASEKAIVISTHILEEVDAVCTRALIIADGKILIDGKPRELEERSERHNAIVFATSAEGVGVELDKLVAVRSIDDLGDGRYRIYPTGGQSILTTITDAARSNGWPIEELTVEAGRLDDVFRRMTTEPHSVEAA